jgi:hypothetical protein
LVLGYQPSATYKPTSPATTIAFISEGNSFVFQDGGANDSFVELVGVTAASVNNTGLNAGSVWIV